MCTILSFITEYAFQEEANLIQFVMICLYKNCKIANFIFFVKQN